MNKGYFFAPIVFTGIIIFLTSIRWLSLDQDISAFIGLPERSIIEGLFDDDIKVYKKGGYDGYLFYSMSKNPFGHPNIHVSEDGQTLHHIDGVLLPKNYLYRTSRVMYPAVSWIISGFGKQELLPLSLILTNLVMVFSLVLVFQVFYSSSKYQWYYLLIPLLFIGLFQSISRDLSDLTLVCFMGLTFMGIYKKNHLLSICAATAAILTKETAAVFLAAPALHGAILSLKRKDGEVFTKTMWWIVPFLIYFVWRFIFLTRYFPAVQSDRLPINNFDLPFLGLIQSLSNTSIGLELKSLILIIVISVSVSLLPLIQHIWINKRNVKLIATPVTLAFLFYLIMAACLSEKVFEDPWSIGRNLLPLQILTFLWMGENRMKYASWQIYFLVFLCLPFYYVMLKGF